jgi:hypothetical protein
MPGFVAVCPQLVGLGGGAGGPAPVAFSDDFLRAAGDTLGGNWTEVLGDIDIFTNGVRGTTVTGVDVAIWTANTVGATQYIRTTIPGGSKNPYHCFRYTDGSTPFYAVMMNVSTGDISWYSMAGNGSSKTQIGATKLLSDWTAFNQPIGMTMEGTGNSTVLRVWANISGLPSAADIWGFPPHLTWTDDPGTASDTGNKLGIGFQDNNISTQFNDFFGGSL